MFAFGVLVLHLATAGAQPLVRLAPQPGSQHPHTTGKTAGARPPPTATTGKPARKAPRPTFKGSTGKPPPAPRSKFLPPRAKIKDLLPKPKTQAASWPRGVERPPHMQGPGRNPRYDHRGFGSYMRRKENAAGRRLKQRLQQRPKQKQRLQQRPRQKQRLQGPGRQDAAGAG